MALTKCRECDGQISTGANPLADSATPLQNKPHKRMAWPGGDSPMEVAAGPLHLMKTAMYFHQTHRSPA